MPTIVNFIKYDVEGNWLNRLENIKNNFHKDSSSKGSFIERFGEEKGILFWEEKTNKTTITLNKCIEKYGKEEGEKKWQEICKSRKSIGIETMIERYGFEEGEKKWKNYLEKWKPSIQIAKERGWNNCATLEQYINKYGELEGVVRYNKKIEHQKEINTIDYFFKKFGKDKGEKKWDEYIKKRNTNGKSAFIERFGKEEGTKKYKEYCDRLSYNYSEKGLIEKYGEEEGLKKRKEMIDRLFWAGSKVSGISKISQKFLWSVFEKLNLEQQKNCFFGELNREFKFYVYENNLTIILADFKMGNKIIEFNGDYWHSFPETKKRDKLKKKYLESKGYEILYIKEKNYNKNPIKEIKKSLKFLNS